MTDTTVNDGTPPTVDVNPFFGGFVLETLTIGLYGEARSAIREYLQNGLDAVTQAVDRGLLSAADARIDIFMDADALVIRDNGVGLGRDRAVSTLTSIGASSKDFRDQAGFRGIGRLAGIAFCNTLTFSTKAKGDPVSTKVVFDAKKLRQEMSPANGGRKSLSDLISGNVKATQPLSVKMQDHFFEVRLDGLVNAPGETADIDQMVDFVSQVAPVAYADDFTYKAQIEKAANSRGFGRRASNAAGSGGLEEVGIHVHFGNRHVEVRKPYGPEFTVGRDDVTLEDIEIRDGVSGKWWGWVGLKSEPGAFKNDSTRAIRVRARNIQIDGTQIMGELFSQVPDAKSYGRFNDWYVGEIFVDPTFVIPNSRRDGFEEDANWETLKSEIIAWCSVLGKRAYEISKAAQHSIQTLAKDARDIENRAKALTAAPQADTDKLLLVSTDVTKLQRRVSRAFKYADMESASQLRSLENRMLDTKTRAVRKLGVSQAVNVDKVREDAQNEVLRELMQAFRDQLDPPTLSKVSQVVASVTGTTDF